MVLIPKIESDHYCKQSSVFFFSELHNHVRGTLHLLSVSVLY